MFAAHMDNSNQLQKWRAPNQSDIEPSGKNPRLFESQQNSGSDLTLFLNYPESDNKNNNLLSTDSVDRFSRMRGFFSLSQWHELELQALIFKYMLVGASVPAELVLAIKKSLVNSPYSYHHLHYQQPTQHYQPNMIPSVYWGKTMVDPEPGRCRRTDGKKWRCSKDVVSGQKYCERHMHRGRNRSRKPVEIPKTSVMGDLKGSITSLLTSPMKDSNFSLSGSPQSKDPGENERSASRREDALSDNFRSEESGSSGKSDSRVLRHFFDDFPRSREPVIRNNDSSPVSSTAHLSISIPRNNVSSDFSLKLSTGNGETPSRANDSAENRCLLFPPLQANWSGWANQQETSVGGPLAEVLRSTSSPTSVLHKIQGCTPETSGISI